MGAEGGEVSLWLPSGRSRVFTKKHQWPKSLGVHKHSAFIHPQVELLSEREKNRGSGTALLSGSDSESLGPGTRSLSSTAGQVLLVAVRHGHRPATWHPSVE